MSQGAISGEYGGCGKKLLCAGALSFKRQTFKILSLPCSGNCFDFFFQYRIKVISPSDTFALWHRNLYGYTVTLGEYSLCLLSVWQIQVVYLVWYISNHMQKRNSITLFISRDI